MKEVRQETEGASRAQDSSCIPQISDLSQQKYFAPAKTEAARAMGAPQKCTLRTHLHTLINQVSKPYLMTEGSSGSSYERPKKRE